MLIEMKKMQEIWNAIVQELIENDALVILGKGLGVFEVASKFLEIHSYSSSFVILVNAPRAVQSQLELLHHARGCDRPCTSINNEYGGEEREAIYAGGGVVAVTSRILAVDLLTGRVPADKLRGLLVWDAHKVSETSSEAFILRLYRQRNKEGFIKGLSDCPDGFGHGFFKVEKVMKCLFVKKLFLWPRFHVKVNSCFAKNEVDLVELKQEMNAGMAELQGAIIDAMDSCLVEMRKTNKIDVSELSIESALQVSFDVTIRRQLNPSWHKVGPKIRQIVEDLKTLRRLLGFLQEYDCVSFLDLVDNLRGSIHTDTGHPPFWIYTPAGQRVFDAAKSRVYRLEGEEEGGREGGRAERRRREGARALRGKALRPVLEVNPKWDLLLEVIEEINETRVNVSSSSSLGPTLLIVKDERTASQTRDMLSFGPHACTLHSFQRYCWKKLDMVRQQRDVNKRKKSNSGMPDVLDVGEDVDLSTFQVETRLLAALAQEEEFFSLLRQPQLRRSTVRMGEGEVAVQGSTGSQRLQRVPRSDVVEVNSSDGEKEEEEGGRDSSLLLCDPSDFSLKLEEEDAKSLATSIPSSTLISWAKEDVKNLLLHVRAGGHQGTTELARDGVLEAFEVARESWEEGGGRGGFDKFLDMWDAKVPRGLEVVIARATSLAQEEDGKGRGKEGKLRELVQELTRIMQEAYARVMGGQGEGVPEWLCREEDEDEDEDENEEKDVEIIESGASGAAGAAEAAGKKRREIRARKKHAASSSKEKKKSRAEEEKEGDGSLPAKRTKTIAQDPTVEDPNANSRRVLKATTQVDKIFSDQHLYVHPLYESLLTSRNVPSTPSAGGAAGTAETVGKSAGKGAGGAGAGGAGRGDGGGSEVEHVPLSSSSIIIHTLENVEEVLHQLHPSFVVVLSPDLSVTRSLETFHADRPELPLRVYFLSYSNSVEEQRFLTEVRRETEAFKSLIETKATMVVPDDQDGKTGDVIFVSPDAPQPTSSRKGGAAAKRRVRVVVDVREFRSALPSLLHQRGLELVPLTLEVGDYVLSPDICVERKRFCLHPSRLLVSSRSHPLEPPASSLSLHLPSLSFQLTFLASVSDLYSSFASGRLFQQVENMTRFYKISVLLIEFDENRPFSLQSPSSISSDIAIGSIISKIVLLTLHFPSLKVMWMRSPYATAIMFDELHSPYLASSSIPSCESLPQLKQNQEEPSPEMAEQIGQDTNQAQNKGFAVVPADILRRLPGVNANNATYIMNHVKSLYDLRMTEQQLAGLIGNGPGKQLYDFIHARGPSSLNSSV